MSFATHIDTIRPGLVIFDCDGVLVDSEIAINEVISRNLATHGLQMSPRDCMDRFMGGTMIAVKQTATSLGASLPDNWIDEIYGEMYARLKLGIAAIDGIAPFLDQLEEAGIAYCVASNGSEEKMAITLGGTKLLGRFENAMFSAHTLGIAKPDPGLFLHAAATFGVEPSDCLVIEDSVAGTRAARLAGMRCFGYAAHDDGSALANEEAIVFGEMRAIAAQIRLHS